MCNPKIPIKKYVMKTAKVYIAPIKISCLPFLPSNVRYEIKKIMVAKAQGFTPSNNPAKIIVKKPNVRNLSDIFSPLFSNKGFAFSQGGEVGLAFLMILSILS